MRRILLLNLGLGALLSACSGGEQRTLSGQLDLAAVGRTRAEVVATRADGLEASAQVASDGRFSLAMESGAAYTVAFRDPSEQRGMRFAQLVFQGSQGRTATFNAVAGDDELGRVEPLEEQSEQEHDSCRSTEQPPADPPTTGTEPPPGGISLFTSFLVAGEDDSLSAEEEDHQDHSNDSLSDGDGDDRCDVNDDDDDDDGLCDDGDDDPGSDDDGGEDHHGGGDEGRADLPYDVRLAVGDSFRLSDAFLEKGPAPAEILGVEMDGSTWRLNELLSDTSFTVTQADCDHQGNRDRGRDRAFISWRNSDGSQEIDHLDLRYCDR